MRTQFATATIYQQSNFTASAGLTLSASASINQTSGFTSSGTLVITASATIAQTSGVSATAEVVKLSSASIDQTSGFTAIGKQIDVAEVADPFTGAELQAYEDLGFCDAGESGPLTELGVFDLGGQLPTNTSGGLIGQGAPPGGVGIAQAVEILRQLRGECPKIRQVKGARTGLAEIHGGTSSFSVVSIFTGEN